MDRQKELVSLLNRYAAAYYEQDAPLVSDAGTVSRIAAAMLDLASAPPGPAPDDGGFHE